MMTEPRRLRAVPEDLNGELGEIERRFHERKFGEEMARVNLDFAPQKRREYLAWMRSNARRRGVPPQPSYSVAWMLKVEQEVLEELAAKP